MDIRLSEYQGAGFSPELDSGLKLGFRHYTPFLYHSNYGIGGSTFKTLFEYLNRYNIKSCGLVDDTFFGLPEFIKHAKTHNIKPIIGAKIPLAPPPLPHLSLRRYRQVDEVPQCEDPRFSSIVNIQYDKSGQSQEITTPATKFGGLVMTKRNCHYEERAPFAPPPNVVAPFMVHHYLYLFAKNQQGYENLCQILTAHAFGDIDINLIKKHSGGLILLSNSIRLLKELSPVFDNKYYLLLPYHTTLKQEFPCIAANEILYVTEKEKLLYKLMYKIKDSKFEYQRGSPHHLLTNEEFNKVFSDYQQAMTNNRILAESCNFIPENKGWIFPRSKQKLCEIIKPITKNSRLSNVETQRIQYEYKIIEKMGFEPYFCLVYHLKEFALSKGIGMNVRGSAAASFILYILGLSIVNPLKYNRQHSWALPMRSRLSDQDQRAVV
jgi:DNA polymerase III alpha subunit